MSRPVGPARIFGAVALTLALSAGVARAQGIDLSHGGPIAITARDGITWLRERHEVLAEGDARATRQDVTVIGNKLMAWYRPKTATPGAPIHPTAAPVGAPPAVDDEGGNEIYRLEAEGAVHIFTPTDRARCDRAVYDLGYSLHSRLLRGDAVAIEGVGLVHHVGNDLQAAVDARFAGQLPPAAKAE